MRNSKEVQEYSSLAFAISRSLEPRKESCLLISVPSAIVTMDTLRDKKPFSFVLLDNEVCLRSVIASKLHRDHVPLQRPLVERHLIH